MKCPKCGYLGFEAVDRCRNCGYDFSLASLAALPELPMRTDAEEINPLDDLALIDAASPDRPSTAAIEFSADIERVLNAPRQRSTPGELPLFTSGDDAPLITKASPPRPPLAVRRATPEVPRLRSEQPKPLMLDLPLPESQIAPPISIASHTRADERIAPARDDRTEPAPVGQRIAAVAIDLLILAAIDAVVIYFTMQICGLAMADLRILPRGPLLAFLLVQNGGYLVAFTAGGQTLGKMAAGIRVISTDADTPLDLGHSIVRTLVWTLLAVPAGLGFITALFSVDRRGLHDRCAGTKVVRISAV